MKSTTNMDKGQFSLPYTHPAEELNPTRPDNIINAW